MKCHQIDRVQQAVLQAAKDGRLSYLKTSLAGRSSTEVKALTSARIEGTTPLIAACREGHIDIVQYLITKCHSDVQQCGSVIFDGETIEDAPPLWCAAAAGHLDIVKCLISNKASPNCTTRTNSTPLRAACFDGHLGIVKYLLSHKADVEIANRHEHTCLMIACYKGHNEIVKTLLEAGATVNRSSIKRNTALHDCAEQGSVPIAKLLLKYNSRCMKDSYGMTPLMTAAVAGHVELVEFFFGLPETSRTEKIEANELLGATYLDKKHDLTNAIHFWRKALELRSMNPPITRPHREPVGAYGYVTEPESLDDLKEIRINLERCRTVALLIRERILGPKHPDTSYFIRYRGAVCADSGDFERCIALWTYALDMQRNNLEPLYPMTLSSLLSFAELFSFMQQNRSHMSSTVPKVNLNQIVNVLERAVNEIILGYKMVKNNSSGKGKTSSTTSSSSSRSPRSGSNASSSDRISYSSSASITSASNRALGNDGVGRSSSNRGAASSCCTSCEVSNQRVYQAMVITLHITALSELIRGDASNRADTAFQQALHRRNQLLYNLRSVRDHCEHSLLHLASCSKTYALGRYPVTRFPNLNVIDVLLQCGFDPNARDCDGKTPAHLTADSANKTKSESVVEVVNRLLAGGAHVDQVDNEGNSVLDLLEPDLLRKVTFFKYQSLQCLCARALAQNGIKLQQTLSAGLTQFVNIH